ncbi:hypothetical protein ASD24_25245 [Paenibacillus sp. Root52]|uniref:ABC-type multidrug transport system permease subunit n=1 Tax=Paenibacillus amylolyticus TaxID=1451 RepID=A0AAP5H8A5_PAEAM|nr:MULTISPECIES: hypothetical protein [Paenibacillus]KQY90207.1 hypothetical protein ASD24_25245 [Paenibacillus sp. Root52]MDR6725699.1 ABC-type multidrug transport system permease subunit [Paenibacillus amylolyticus]
MIYWVFGDMNPLFAVFVMSPIIALMLGVVCFYRRRFKIMMGMGVSFVLPLLFIASDRGTLWGNAGIGIVYGVGYSLITLLMYKGLNGIKN